MYEEPPEEVAYAGFDYMEEHLESIISLLKGILMLLLASIAVQVIIAMRMREGLIYDIPVLLILAGATWATYQTIKEV